MAFTDDFNRADEDLEADAGWTLVGGTAGDAAIVSNVVKCVATASTAGAYQCTDQGAGGKYSQAVIKVTGSEPFPVCLRLTDGSNFIGVRAQGGAWQCYKRNAGSFTLEGSYSATIAVDDIVYIEEDGSDNFDVKINGISRIKFSESFNSSETRQGCASRSGPYTAWFDDFEASLLPVPASKPSGQIQLNSSHALYSNVVALLVIEYDGTPRVSVSG